MFGHAEDAALAILSHALDCVKDKRYRQEDSVCPIVRMQTHLVAQGIGGVASGRAVRYNSMLKAEFVSVGMTSRPYRDLYFKVFPRGAMPP